MAYTIHTCSWVYVVGADNLQYFHFENKIHKQMDLLYVNIDVHNDKVKTPRYSTDHWFASKDMGDNSGLMCWSNCLLIILSILLRVQTNTPNCLKNKNKKKSQLPGINRPELTDLETITTTSLTALTCLVRLNAFEWLDKWFLCSWQWCVSMWTNTKTSNLL